MKREDKDLLIESLNEKFSVYPVFYITDISNLTAEKTTQLRRLCHERGIVLQVAKNTFIKKALEKTGKDYSGFFDSLKGSSSLMFCDGVANIPAKLIKEFRKKSERPVLKAAYVESSIYIGDAELGNLVSLKSKEELIGDIVALLQSPAKNVVSALQSGKHKIAGIVKTLSEKKEE